MNKQFVKYPKPGKIYQHYKGGRYKVISMAKHSETQEVVVIYQSQEFKSFHVRPLVMWFQKVKISKFKSVSRFEEIKK